VWDRWNYEQDISFEEYLNILCQFGDIVIGGYGVYNPFLDEEAGYTF
jgi:hypothetical protein